ncbi:hypothetical protein [Helicobacter cetorum]|uniref:Cell division protein FtsZ n=1 Tax=Helicobacter cetorum (strain ATCC BAA-429 / MIT 00-7128) TaxID=182217 RepID=I0EL55_HELC0|nr:hypothetical protein [Helicobacter cetorum]AFI03674.1 cell division protein FtsZ [Helicobacter cetorum MIT 00-7128]
MAYSMEHFRVIVLKDCGVEIPQDIQAGKIEVIDKELLKESVAKASGLVCIVVGDNLVLAKQIAKDYPFVFVITTPKNSQEIKIFKESNSIVVCNKNEVFACINAIKEMVLTQGEINIDMTHFMILATHKNGVMVVGKGEDKDLKNACLIALKNALKPLGYGLEYLNEIKTKSPFCGALAYFCRHEDYPFDKYCEALDSIGDILHEDAEVLYGSQITDTKDNAKVILILKFCF